MDRVKLMLVGGFLGAGKTTLLWQSASRLISRGMRVGLITNDQAPDLVDTELLSGQGMSVQEVSGSCFCCNFSGLVEAAEKLQHDVNADVLIAEPVGSCTDLSATILQPLKDKFRQEFELSPLSVLVDPTRLRDILSGGPGGLHESAAYVVRKQIEEADVIVLNKSDLLEADQLEELRSLTERRFPDAEVRRLSALTGEGVGEWLDAMLERGRAGQKVVDVDYDTYAEGEAVLGWLNAVIRLSSEEKDVDWRVLCGGFMDGLKTSFREMSAEVGHVKTLVVSKDGRWVANLTRTDGEVAIRGDEASNGRQAQMIVNARVEMSPEALEKTVRNDLRQSCERHGVEAEVFHLQSLSPGRPQPTYRYEGVIDA